MDPELRLLDLMRRDWWLLFIVLFAIWVIESYFEGNSVFEIIAMPVLLVVWGALIYLLDQWVASCSDRQNGGVDLRVGPG
jgi:hypothetical protein